MDFNCDLGEGLTDDAVILPYIHSASIACGIHAGSPEGISSTIQLARQAGVRVGAHPSWNDRVHFGRVEQQVPSAEIVDLIIYQIGAIDALCVRHNWPMVYVKPHGALYNQAAKDPRIAAAVVEAVQSFRPSLQLYALANSVLATLARESGLAVVQEAFADRRYSSAGELLPRSHPQALLETPEEVLEQVNALVCHGEVRAVDGNRLSIKADSLCIHGDGRNAAELAKIISAYLKAGNPL